jgi:hypothetical protein
MFEITTTIMNVKQRGVMIRESAKTASQLTGKNSYGIVLLVTKKDTERWLILYAVYTDCCI